MRARWHIARLGSAIVLLSLACGRAADPAAAETAEIVQATKQDDLKRIVPAADCVVDHGRSRFTAYFGYRNDGAAASVEIGGKNKFEPKPQDRGQPTLFRSGGTPPYPAFAVRIDFDGSSLEWKLPGGKAALHSASRRCPDTAAPEWPAGSRLAIARDEGDQVQLRWTAARDDAAVAAYRIYANGSLSATVGGHTLETTVRGLSAQHDYRFKIEAGDAAGNWSTSGPSALRDEHAPVVTITGVSEGQVSRADQLVPAFTATDDLLASVFARLDGAPFTSGTPVSSEGAHALVVTASDQAGHVTTVMRHFTLDRTAPAVSLGGVADGARVNRPVTLTYTATDATALAVTALLDGAPFASGDTVSADGAHAARVTAVDAAGNSAQASLSFFIDRSAPAVAILTPVAPAVLASRQVDVRAAVAEPGPLASVTANGAPMALHADGTWRVQLALAEGPNLIAVAATDLAGNTGNAQVQVTIDLTPPRITIEQPASGAKIAASSVTVLGTVRDATAVAVTVAGQPAQMFGDGSFSATVPLAPGANTIAIAATDAAGNAARVDLAVRSNTAAPSARISSPADGTVTSATAADVRVVASPADPADSVAVIVNGAAAARQADGTFLATVPLAPNASTAVRAQATDGYGLTAAAQIAIVHDSIAPQIAIAGVADGQFSNAPALQPSFGAADDHQGTVEALLDGRAFQSGAPVSAEGAHTLAVTARDAAGNESQRTVRFTLDRVAPAISVEGVADGALLSAAVAISWSADDANLETADATLDGSPFASGGTVSAEGAHTLIVAARDKAGNEAARTVRFRIDATPPRLIVRAPADGSFTSKTPADVVVEVPGDTAGASRVTAAGVLLVFSNGAFRGQVPLAEGRNSIAIVVTDTAGNSASQAVQVTLDTAPPLLDVTSPVEGARIPALASTVSGTVADANLALLTVNGAHVPVAADRTFSTTVELQQGANVLAFVATDRAGNSTALARNVRANDVPPGLHISEPVDLLVTSATVIAVRGSATAGDSSDDQPVRVDAAGFAATLTGAAFEAAIPLLPGANVIHVVARDSYGLETSADVTVIQDSVGPVITVSGVADGQVSAAALSVSFSADDEHLASLQATLDGAPIANPAVVVAEGDHALLVVAADAAGNSSSLRVAFAIDRTPPLVQLDAPPEASRVRGPLTVSFGATDAHLASVTGKLDGADVAANQPILVEGEGGHRLAVVALDAAGNHSAAERMFIVDRTAPAVTISAPADRSVFARRAIDVVATVAEEGPLTSVIANGQPLQLATNGWWTGQVTLGDGETLVEVLAVDAAGNEGRAVVRVRFDDAAPALRVETPADGARIAAAATTVSGVATDATRVTVAVNGSPAPVATDGRFSVTVPLIAGANAITTRATDEAGNASEDVRTVRSNTSPPAIAIDSPASGVTTADAQIEVTGTATPADPLDSVTVTVNGAPAAVQAGGRFTATVSLAEGANVITASATDGYGLSAEQGVLVTRSATSGSPDAGADAGTPDAGPAAPAIRIDTPADGAILAAATVTVSGTVTGGTPPLAVTVDGAPALLTGNSFSATLAPAEGDRTVVATVADGDGRTATAERSFHIDRTPPALTITRPATSPSRADESPYTVQGTVSDAWLQSVTVNGAAATVLAGTFAAQVPIQLGDNEVIVTARDQAGNETTRRALLTAMSVAPLITVLAPAAGSESADAIVLVRVQVSSTARIAEVLIGTGAARHEGGGLYSAQVALALGPNLIPIAATDVFGARGTATADVRFKDPATEALTVQNVEPASGAAAIDPDTIVSITFNKPFVASSLEAGFTVTAGGQPLPGGFAISPSSQTASFVPRDQLPEGGRITVRVSGVEAQAGPGMRGDFTSDFQVRPRLTVVRGSVVDEVHLGIAGVPVELEGADISTRTESDGNFTLFAKAGGTFVLRAGGSADASGAPLPVVRRRVYVASQEETTAAPIVLAPTDGRSAQFYDGSAARIDFQGVHPGLSLEVPASGITFPDGQTSGFLTATKVTTLAAPPPSSRRRPTALWQLGPAGTRFVQPVRIATPNLKNLPPGKRALLFGYDPQALTLVPIGYARVTDDGRSVRSEQRIPVPSLEYFGYTALSDAEQDDALAQAAPMAEQPSAVLPGLRTLGTLKGAATHSSNAIFRSPSAALIDDMPGVWPFWLFDFGFRVNWVKGRITVPHEFPVEIQVFKPIASVPLRVTLGQGGRVCIGTIIDPAIIAACPAGLETSFRATFPLPAPVEAQLAVTQNGNAIAAPAGENWDPQIPGPGQAALMGMHVPLAHGVTRVSMMGAALLNGVAEHTEKVYTIELKLPPAAANAPPNVYDVEVKEEPPTEPEGMLDGIGLFSYVPVYIGGEATVATDQDGAYFYMPLLYWGFDEELTSIAEFPLPSRRVQDKPGHFVQQRGVYYGKSAPYGTGPDPAPRQDIFIDARLLTGTLNFKYRDGSLAQVCNDGSRTAWLPSGEAQSISNLDVGATEVYFFREDDLANPIAEMAPAGSLAQDGECRKAGGHATYWRLRLGPSDRIRAAIRAQCDQQFPPGTAPPPTPSDFYKQWCSPEAQRKNFLRLGVHDRLVMVAVNHATGYSGMKTIEVPPINDRPDSLSCRLAPPRQISVNGRTVKVPACTSAKLEITGDIDLYPPEIDVRVTRKVFEEGLPVDDKQHLVRLGGAGTTNDKLIAVDTHWRVRRKAAADAGPPDAGPATDPDCQVVPAPDGGPEIHRSRLDGGYCQPHRLFDRDFDGGTARQPQPLEIYCSMVPPGGDLTKCLRDDQELSDPPAGVPPLAGRIWSETGAAGGEPLPVYFNVMPGRKNVLVNASIPIFNAADAGVTFGNLTRAHYYLQVVGNPKPTRDLPPPDFTDETSGPNLGRPKKAIPLKAVYKGLDADGRFQMRFERDREHQFSVIEIGDRSIEAQSSLGDRNLLDGGTAAPEAQEDDQSYRLLMTLTEPTDIQRAAPPGEYELRLGGDVAGQTCKLQIQDQGGGRKSLSGSCGGDSLMDVLSASDVLYLELYLSGNAENVLYRFNFNGLTLRQDQLPLSMKTTKEKAGQSEASGTRVLRRSVMEPGLAQFFAQPSELKKGRLKLCLEETCATADKVLKTLKLEWTGADYDVSDLNVGRDDTRTIAVTKRTDFGVQDAKFFTIPLPNDVLKGLGYGTGVWVRYEPVEPRLQPFSRPLGQPLNVFQNRGAQPPGHHLVAGIDIADGHAALHHEDLSVPEGGSTVRFERVFNNQNNDLRPLGIGWTHNYDAWVLEEAAGRYTVVIGGQSYDFPACVVTRDPVSNKAIQIEQCKTDKAHGGQMEVRILFPSSTPGSQRFKFIFTREADRHRYTFDRLAAHDERTARDEGGRKWLLTSIDDGKGQVALSYKDGTDLIDYAERDIGKLRLQFDYKKVDQVFNGDPFPGTIGARLRRQELTDGFQLLKAVRVQPTGGGADIDSVQFEHDEDLLSGGAIGSVRAGNLTGVWRRTQQPYTHWRYDYPNLAGAPDTAWILRNEMTSAKLEVSGSVQKEWIYQRSGTVQPYEHSDKREVIDSVTIPGKQGLPIVFEYGSAVDRTVKVPDERGATREVVYKLNAFGNVVSVKLPGGAVHNADWLSDSDDGIARPRSVTSASGMSMSMDYGAATDPDPLALSKKTLASGPAGSLPSPNVAPGDTLQAFTPDDRWVRPKAAEFLGKAGNKRKYTQVISDQGLTSLLTVTDGISTITLQSESQNPDGTCASGQTPTGVQYICSGPDALGLPTAYQFTAPGGAGGGLSSATIQLTYDPLGRLTRQQNSATGGDEQWAYDGLGRITKHQVAGSPAQTWDYSYDDNAVKTLIVTETLNGTQIGTQRFDDGLPTVRTWSWGSGSTAQETRSYKGGILTSSSTDTGLGVPIARTYAYDAQGRLTDVTVAGAGTELHFELDADGRITGKTDHNGLVTTIGNDANGRPVRWDFGGGDVMAVEREGNGSDVTAQINGSHRVEIDVDPIGRLREVKSATDASSYDVKYSGSDAAGRLNSMIDEGLTETWVYADALGRLTQHTRAVGAATLVETYTYGSSSSGSTIELKQQKSSGTPALRVVLTTLDAAGRAVSVRESVDGQDSETTTDYDARGNPRHLTTASGTTRQATTELIYDDGGRLVRARDGENNTVEHTVDALGRIKGSKGPRSGEEWTFDHDAFGEVKSRTLAGVTGAPGGTWTYDRSARDGSVIEKDPAGVTTVSRYNARGLLLSEEKSGPGGTFTTTFEYDGGREKKRTSIEGSWKLEVARQYDDRGRTTSVAESWTGGGGSGYAYTTTTAWSGSLSATRTDTWPGGTRTTDLTLDGLGHVVQSVQGGSITRATWDAAGLQTSFTAEGLDTVSFDYESSGRPKRRRQSAETTENTYTADGLLETVTDPSNRVARYSYDLAGRRKSATYGQGSNQFGETYDYADGGGEPTSVRQLDNTLTQYAYAPGGRILSATLPGGVGTWRYEYRSDGLLSKVHAPNHTDWQSYDYDYLKRSTRRTLGSGLTWSATWTDGKSTVTDSGGNAVETALDGRGRPATVRFTPGASSVSGLQQLTYSYTDLNQVAQVVERRDDATVNQALTFDDRGRIKTIDRDEPSGSTRVEYTYKPFDAVATVTTPGGATQYEYDSHGRVKRIDGAAGRSTSVEWESGGQRLTRIDDGTSAEARCYNGQGWISKVVSGTGVTASCTASTVASKVEYSYDARGNRLSEQRSGAAGAELIKYGFDDADRMTGVRYGDGRAVLYSLSPTGSRLGEAEVASHPANGDLGPSAFASATSPSRKLSYTLDDSERLTAITDVLAGAPAAVVTTDAAGRVSRLDTPAAARTLRWDAAGRMVGATVTAPDPDPAAANPTITRVAAFRYDHANQRTRADVGPESRSFVWADETVLEERPDLGSPAVYERAGGTVASVGNQLVQHDGLESGLGHGTSQASYDAWGNFRSGEPQADAPTLAFAGQHWDPAAKLSYAQQRWYAPELGRFLSVDPEAGDPSAPATLHPFTYAGGNPVRYRDPNGRAINLGFAAAGAAGGFVVGCVASFWIDGMGVKTCIKRGLMFGAAGGLAGLTMGLSLYALGPELLAVSTTTQIVASTALSTAVGFGSSAFFTDVDRQLADTKNPVDWLHAAKAGFAAGKVGFVTGTVLGLFLAGGAATGSAGWEAISFIAGTGVSDYVGQQVSVGMGLQDHYDWRNTAVAVVTAGVLQAVPRLMPRFGRTPEPEPLPAARTPAEDPAALPATPDEALPAPGSVPLDPPEPAAAPGAPAEPSADLMPIEEANAGARSHQRLAASLNKMRSWWARRNGTTAAIRAVNRATGEEKTFFAIEGKGDMPKQWQGQVAPEDFVSGPGHAEETILKLLKSENQAGAQWQVKYGGASRNICEHVCTPLIKEFGLNIGGTRFRVGRVYKQPYREFSPEEPQPP